MRTKKIVGGIIAAYAIKQEGESTNTKSNGDEIWFIRMNDQKK